MEQQLLQSLSSAGDASHLLELTLEHFGAQTGTIHVLERDGLLHLRALAGALPPPVLEAIQVIPVGKGIAGLAVERRAPVNICNLQTDSSGAARPSARSTGVQGSICVPMMVDGQAVGALGIGTYQERTFTEEEIALLLAAGREIGSKLWSS
jgi:L-methionine (R)-S-oxide reductase